MLHGGTVTDPLKANARLFRDLGHSVRLRILCLLAREGRQCVCRMLPDLGVPQPTLSRHLAVLRDHGLIEDEREGAMVFYRIADRAVLPILRAAGLPCACVSGRKGRNASARRREP
jgi:DNA-binding transcriptional ArsR family regulator